MNGKPNIRNSQNEVAVSTKVGMDEALWRTTTFKIINSFPANSNIWFGGFSDGCIATKFDYGGIYYTTAYDLTPNFPINGKEKLYDYILSWYFTYTLPQNYVRKLTQGIKLTDGKKPKADYKRSAIQTLKVTTALSKAQAFLRQCLITVSNTMEIDRIRGFLRFVIDQAGLFEEMNHKWEIKRKCAETAGIQWHKEQKQDFSREITDNDNVSDYRKLTADYIRETYQTVQGNTNANAFISFLRQCVMKVGNSIRIEEIQNFLRSVFDQTGLQEELQNRREIAIGCKENAGIIGEVNRSKGFIREIIDSFNGIDNNDYNVLFVRTVNETQGITDSLQKCGDYIRALYVEAGNIAITAHRGEYYRNEIDTVQAGGLVLRQLSIFLRILTKTIIRDYIIGRFLIAREELRLKSCIVREIVLESKIS